MEDFYPLLPLPFDLHGLRSVHTVSFILVITQRTVCSVSSYTSTLPTVHENMLWYPLCYLFYSINFDFAPCLFLDRGIFIGNLLPAEPVTQRPRLVACEPPQRAPC